MGKWGAGNCKNYDTVSNNLRRKGCVWPTTSSTCDHFLYKSISKISVYIPPETAQAVGLVRSAVILPSDLSSLQAFCKPLPPQRSPRQGPFQFRRRKAHPRFRPLPTTAAQLWRQLERRASLRARRLYDRPSQVLLRCPSPRPARCAAPWAYLMIPRRSSRKWRSATVFCPASSVSPAIHRRRNVSWLLSCRNWL